MYWSRQACSKTFFEKQVLCENCGGLDKDLPDRGQAQLCQEMKKAVGGLQWGEGSVEGLGSGMVPCVPAARGGMDVGLSRGKMLCECLCCVRWQSCWSYWCLRAFGSSDLSAEAEEQFRQHESSSHQKWQWQLEEMVKQCLDQFHL